MSQQIKPELVEYLQAAGLDPSQLVFQAAKIYAQPLEDTVSLFLSNPVDVPLNDGSNLSVRFIPPARLDGVTGVFKSDVLILTKYPDDSETRNNCYGSSRKGGLLRNAFKERNVEADRWLIAGVCPYTPPKHLITKKDSNLAQGQYLLQQVLAKASPKYVLLLGAEALKGFLRAYDKHKNKVSFKDCRGTQLVMPDGVIGVVCTSPEEVLKAPESLNDFNLDIDYFMSVISKERAENTDTGFSSTNINVKHITISTLSDFDIFIDWFNNNVKEAYLSIDLEWGAGTTLRTFQLAWSPDDCVVFHINHEGLVPTELGTQTGFRTFIQKLQALFDTNKHKVIGHNIRGDIKILRRFGLDIMRFFVEGGFDTMIAYHLIPGNETLEKQLELVAFRMLNCQRYDKPLRDWFSENKISDEQKELLGYGTVPDDILIPYGAMDSIVTYRIFLLLKEQLASNADIYSLYYDINHPLNEPILEMEETGLLCDQHRLRELSDLFVNKSKELLQQLQEMVNWKPSVIQQTKIVRGKPKVVEITEDGFNPDSPTQCQEVLFSKFPKKGRKAPPTAKLLSLTPVKSTGGKAGGLPWESVEAAGMTQVTSAAVDAETLGILVNESPVVDVLHRYKVVNQLVKNLFTPYTHNPDTSEYVYEGGVGGNLSVDGRFRTSFRTTLETGRYATSPQLQNWPKKQEAELIKIFTENGVLNPKYKLAKSVLVADPGMVLLEADWNQAELWTLGYVSNDMKFIDTLQKTDLHTYMMRKMMGEFKYKDKYVADFTVEELNVLRKKDKLLESWRTSAKAVVFGIPYCRGARAICQQLKAQGVHATVEQAQAWINAFLAEYQNIAAYIQACKDAVVQVGYVKNVYGRYRYFPPCDDSQIVAAMQREAVNFGIQSTVADSMSKALINLFNYRKNDPSLKYKIVLSVHDAIILLCPIDQINITTKKVLPDCMCNNLEVPGIKLHYTLGDIDIQKRWGENLSKDEVSQLCVV